MNTLCNIPATNLIYKDPDYKVLLLDHNCKVSNNWYPDIKPNNLFSSVITMWIGPVLLKEFNDQSGAKISIEIRSLLNGDLYLLENYPFIWYKSWVKN